MPKLTETQRVEARMLMGVMGARKVAEILGVNERSIRRAWNPANERMREAARRRERNRRDSKGSSVAVATIDYRAKGLGPGKDAQCQRCRRVYAAMDFQTDVITGLVIEPRMCWRCVG